jgi:hypothetical protein
VWLSQDYVRFCLDHLIIIRYLPAAAYNGNAEFRAFNKCAFGKSVANVVGLKDVTRGSKFIVGGAANAAGVWPETLDGDV